MAVDHLCQEITFAAIFKDTTEMGNSISTNSRIKVT